MDHNYYREILHASFLGEADAKQQDDLRRHILECAECRHALESLKSLDEFLVPLKTRTIPERILLQAREELRNRIRIERKKELTGRLWPGIITFFTDNNRQILSGAAAMAAGLVIGFFLFRAPVTEEPAFTGNSIAQMPEDNTGIRNIRLTDSDPDDDIIEFSFEAVKDVRVRGSLNDSNIRDLLMYAAMNGSSAGVRLNSLNALNSSGAFRYDQDIREAILAAAKYDDNPGVRREALKFLKSFPFDQDIKKMYLYIILNDTSSAMRIEAINGLALAGENGMTLSKDEEKLFRDRLLNDENDYIRFRAKTVLEEHRL